MRLQTKLLIFLLAIALPPLVFVTWFDHRAMEKLGAQLAGRSRAALIDRAKEQLAQMTDDYAALIGREQQILELIIEAQAREADRCLARSPKPGETVFFASDLDKPGPHPQIQPSPRHYRYDAQGHATPISVDYQHQAFRLVPGLTRSEAADDIARLAPMDAFYRRINRRFGDLIYWQYIALQTGLHSAYPGHGGYPRDFDPRKRLWYTEQKGQPGPLWSPPMVDASTRQVLLSLTMPVYRPDGSFAGVTGLDVPITAVLRGHRLATGWAQSAQAFIVAPQADPRNGRTMLRVLAKQDYRETGQSWSMSIEPQWLDAEGVLSGGGVIGAMEHERPNMAEIPYQGQPALWAWKAFNSRGDYLLFIVPYARIIESADEARSLVLGQIRTQIQAVVPVLAIVVLAVLLIALFGARTVTRPLNALAQTIRRVAGGDFSARAVVRGGGEVAGLAADFNAMVPQLQERMQMRQSLALAKEVQQRLLPSAPPQIEGLDIAGRSVYCDETGGDYYDFLVLGEALPGAVAIAVGDVAGHGLASALQMTSARALLHTFAGQRWSPAQIMDGINAQLCEDAHAGHYMTLFYLMLDTRNQRLRWASAGHQAALCYDPKSASFSELGSQDIPLGVDPDWQYWELAQGQWLPGGVIVLATDGVWETRDAQGEMFGTERLRELVARHAALPAQAMCERMLEALDAFRAGGPRQDDVTLVVVKLPEGAA